MNTLSTFKRLWCFIILLSISNYLVGQTLDYVPNQLLVKFKANVASTLANNTMQSMSADVVENFENLSIQQWEVPNVVSLDDQNFTNLEDLAEYLMENNESIEFAEPDYYINSAPATFTPNDPNFNLLWSMNNTGQTGGTAGVDISALEAWAVTTGNKDIVVGVLDSGIDWSHPDLVNNIWQNSGEDTDGDGLLVQVNGEWVFDEDDMNGIDDDGNGYVDDFVGWDFVNNDNNPEDLNSHGTHVAGTIAASGNNGVGVVGVSHEVQIMPLRFLNSDGVGAVSDAVRGLNYAMSKGVQLTNNSWGSTGLSESLRSAIEQAAEANQLFIASAGNNASNNDEIPNYPSSFDLDNIIAVAATNASDQLAAFSNYGATTVDIAAPGVAIFSTLPNGEYGNAQGTSMAAPHVTGTAVLLWAENPTATYSKIKDAILSSVDPVSSLEGVVGAAGRLNTYNALLAMQECTVVADFNTPTGVVCPGTLQSFENISTDGIAYGWYLSDTLYTTDENAKITFPEAGEYEVKLVADGEGEDCSVEISKTVFVTGAPSSDFDHSTGSLEVTFDPHEINEDFTYQWNFGDDNTSQESNPVHTYLAAGEYEVTLIVTNQCDASPIMTKTVVVEELALPNCPTLEDFTPASQNLTTCNNPDGNIVTLPTVSVGGDFGANAIAVWAQVESDPIQVAIGENNEVNLEQHIDCEIGSYHFYLTIQCLEDESIVLDGGSAVFSVYPEPQAPVLERSDDECNYTVLSACDFDEVSPNSIFVEQGAEAGTTEISVSNLGCTTASVFAVDYEACPAVISEECPSQSDVSPASSDRTSCSNLVTLPFVPVGGDHSENAVFMWSLMGNPDFEIPLGQTPVVELPENTDCEAKDYVFRLDIACSVDEGTFLEGGTVNFTLYPEPQAPTIIRLDDDCNYQVVKNCESDLINMNPEDLVQAPDTEAGTVRVEVSNEGCANPYEYFVEFEACPPACPKEEEISMVEEHVHLCNSIDGNKVTLPEVVVEGEAAENAVFVWTQIGPEGLEVEVGEGASPVVDLPQNTECKYVLYEFELIIKCSKDESVNLYGGYASYEVYAEPQAPMIERTQDEETGICSYAVIPYCEGDIVTPDSLEDQVHHTPAGFAVFEVSNEGCEARVFEVEVAECPTVCVLEEEFEKIGMEESICNTEEEEGNKITLPELSIESENAESATFTWTQIENGAPMLEIAAGAAPTLILEQNKTCEAVSYEFVLTVGCSKDESISYEGGQVNYTLYPAPQAPTIERSNSEEIEAEVCSYIVVAACENDELSETEFTQDEGSGEKHARNHRKQWRL